MRRTLTASAVLLSASLFSFGQTIPSQAPVSSATQADRKDLRGDRREDRRDLREVRYDKRKAHSKK